MHTTYIHTYMHTTHMYTYNIMYRITTSDLIHYFLCLPFLTRGNSSGILSEAEQDVASTVPPSSSMLPDFLFTPSFDTWQPKLL